MRRAVLDQFRGQQLPYAPPGVAGDPAFEELAARLQAASPEVRAWWPRHDIAPLSSGTKRLRHPVLGELELRHVVLLTADDVEQKLVAFLASDADQARIAELIAAG